MKIKLLAAILVCFLVAACNSAKKTSGAAPDPAKLAGTWDLTYIAGSTISFEALFPNKKPVITVDVVNSKVAGNAGCNSFNAAIKLDGSKISFVEPIVMTKMACGGEGENVFIATLKQVNSWSVSHDTLSLMTGDVTAMRFLKK